MPQGLILPRLVSRLITGNQPWPSTGAVHRQGLNVYNTLGSLCASY